ncbi:unknown [Clostridium sp. CAG:798]|jgi:murein DD-endopeptidase MepM/ murein hydrolase activator NlpD|nr:unknown [Clostridium sp. CAG:798]
MFMECQVIHIKMRTGSPTNGATTGPHLHLGVRYNDEYINPLSLFN